MLVLSIIKDNLPVNLGNEAGCAPLHRRSWRVLILLMLLPACTRPTDGLVSERRAWTVMGTTFEVTGYRPRSDSSLASANLEAAHAEVVEIDRLMSLYRPDSELMALNAQAGNGGVPISDPTFEVLRAAEHYARLSDVAIDVTVHPLVALWGFYRVERAAIPPTERIDAVLQQVGVDRVALDASSRTVTLESGTALDLGSIAKGYAVDRALAALGERGVPSALVDLGGNIGVLGQAPGGRPWVVGIRHPRGDRLIGEVRFRSGAVATSGDYDRYFEVDGKRYSHLLDPRTGWPVGGVYSLTVVAPNATAADALSTAAFVLGPEHGMALLANCEGVEDLVVEPSGDEGRGAGEAEELVVGMTTDHVTSEGVSFVLEPETSSTLRPREEPVDLSPVPECVLPISSVN